MRRDAPAAREDLRLDQAAVAAALEGLRRAVSDERGSGHHVTVPDALGNRVDREAADRERGGGGGGGGCGVYEVEDGLELLHSLGLRERKSAELIACPTCGRIQVDLISLVQDVRKTLASKIELPIKVAVMGCIVNGPGEAEGADVAVFAGDRRGIIYVQGEKVANVPEEEILEKLLVECLKFQEEVKAGRVKLGDKKVEIIPPDPIGSAAAGKRWPGRRAWA